MTLTVLQIIPNLGTGGAEQACVDMAAAIAARGDVSLVVSEGGRRVGEIEKAGARHILGDVATKNPAKIIRNALWLAKIIKAHKVDIVHARSRAPAWSAYLACKKTGCHYITTFHAAYKFKSRVKKAYNSVMAMAERCIAISPFIADYMRQSYGLGDDKIRLINRGIDVETFNPAAVSRERQDNLLASWRIGWDRPIFLLPARLSPIKNHSLIIQAMALLKEAGKPLPLVCFVGDDQGRVDYSEALKRKIGLGGLEECVKLVGPCSDMPAAYSLASLVLMPSKVPEGFGRVPVESMAMGVPVIASNLGATQTTIVEGQTGWLLPPDDAAAWAKKMEAVMALSEEQRRDMAAWSRQHVVEQFSHEGMIVATLAVYDEVMREKK